MIIQILSELKEEGYLAKGRHPTVAPFFSCSNVAFRLNAFKETGGFDPQCITGEDCDICAQLSSKDWELYTRRDSIVYHKNPTSLRQLSQKWYGYGRYHPYVFARHNERAVEIYMRLLRPLEGERYVCLFYKRSPKAIVLFVTSFLFLNLAILATGAAWLAGMHAACRVGLGLSVFLAGAYAWPDLRGSGLIQGLALTATRYVADVALFIGAFIGGLRQRLLYFSATVD